MGCGRGAPPETGADTAAASVVVTSDLGAPADECSLPCVAVEGPAGAGVALVSGGVLLDRAEIGADGTAALCPAPASLEPGDPLSVESDGVVIASATADIRPFGYALGRVREWGAVDEIAWDMDWALDAAPFFLSSGWYAEGITSPHLSADGQTLYFSGKGTPSGPYRLGAVAVDGLEVVSDADEPLLLPPAERWDALGQVSPTLITDGDTRWLYYHGLGEGAEVPTLGRAVSVAGGAWEAPQAPAYGDPADDKVSHPAAILDDAGLVELWHLNHDGGIALSLSADGETFTPSCRALPMRGKSPEVSWDGERYRMTWSTADDDGDIIRWAESRDGIRWRQREAPILRDTDAQWTQDGLSNAQLVSVDGEPALLMVGVSDGVHSFGLARPGGSR